MENAWYEVKIWHNIFAEEPRDALDKKMEGKEMKFEEKDRHH